MTVYGTPAPRSPMLREFLDRQRRGGVGRFITAEDLARRQPAEVSAALRGVPGLQLAPNGRLGTVIVGRDTFGQACPATVFLNGLLLGPGDAIDAVVSPRQLAGIEVYNDAIFAPPQYNGSGRYHCSVVLVWTQQ